MCTLEAIIKSSENFPGVFEVNQRGKDLGIYELHGEAKENILKNQNSEAVVAITNETFFLINCNQLESFKGFMLRFSAKDAG